MPNNVKRLDWSDRWQPTADVLARRPCSRWSCSGPVARPARGARAVAQGRSPHAHDASSRAARRWSRRRSRWPQPSVSRCRGLGGRWRRPAASWLARPAQAGTAWRLHPLLAAWLVRALVGAALGSAARRRTRRGRPTAPVRCARAPPAAAAETRPARRRRSGPAHRRSSRCPEPPRVAASETRSRPRGEPTQHTVVAGDSLWRIAADHLPATAPRGPSSTAGWHALYDANRRRLGDDPDLIRPGTVLRLPRPLA